MNQDECVQALRQLMAEAIMLGTKMAEKPYNGLFFDENNRPFWESLGKLHQHTAEFLGASGLDSISPGDVLPIQTEMKRIFESRS